MTTTRVHRYSVALGWTGNRGEGTARYTAYGHEHVINGPGKPTIHGSSDPVFRGDASRYSPEELLVAALSGCHMLWYLHVCAEHRLIVEEYSDAAVGVMEEDASGTGRFVEVTLRPNVTFRSPFEEQLALELHRVAHEFCFVAASVNFPVAVAPEVGQLSSSPPR